MPSRQIRIAFRDVDPHDVPLSPAKPRSRSGGASALEFHLPSQCHLLRSANADDAQTSWRNAGERRGGRATVTEPTETAEISALRVKANAGDASAQFNLGFAYDRGQDVPQDYAQSVVWYRKAADQGEASAQFNLALMYADGQGVPHDAAQEAAWFRKAAEQGHARAQHNLGVMYRNGHGVPQDYVESHKWFNLAASRASAEDQKQFAEFRNGVAQLMTPAQLAEAQKLAREWLAASEKRGGT